MTREENCARKRRHESRVTETIAHEAALFIADMANTRSMITVTRAAPSAHGDRITVFISVFPEAEIESALTFLSRQREAFSDYLKKKTRIAPLPRVEFVRDIGEENRRRIEELSQGI